MIIKFNEKVLNETPITLLDSLCNIARDNKIHNGYIIEDGKITGQEDFKHEEM